MLQIFLPLILYAIFSAPNLGAQTNRIASASIASDEILWSLLTPTQRQRQVVAFSNLVTNPAYSNIAAQVPAKKAIFGASLEALLSTQPNLAFVANFNRPEIAQRLKAAGVRTITLKGFNSWQDLRKNITLVASAIDEKERGRLMLATLNQRLTELRTKHQKLRPKVMNFSPENILAGKDTMFDAIIKAAGATNLVGTLNFSGWQKTSVEKIAQLDPDFIVVSGDPRNQAQMLAQLKTRPGWNRLAAIKHGRVIIVPAALLSSVSLFALDAAQFIQEQLRAQSRKS